METSKIPVRSVWSLEAGEFTPWLRKNINFLEAALNLKLTPTDVVDEMKDRRKVKIGSFFPDILAEDEKGQLVIIENQLEGTNHSHLGQLITYASGLNAKVVIWVVPSFRDDHRWALDWLNEQSQGRVKYFGVEVAAVRSSDSTEPQITFSVVAHPADWQGEAVVSSTKAKKPTHQHVFLKQIAEQIKAQRSDLKPFVENPSRLKIHAAFGNYGVSFLTRRNLRVVAAMDTEDKDRLFRALRSQRLEIERAYGEPLNWEEEWLSITVSRPIPDFTDEAQLSIVADWAVGKLLRLMNVLDERIAHQMAVRH